MHIAKTDTIPVEVVFGPDWWHHKTGMTFDKDFFFHPKKRVESERRMEAELFDRFGRYGLGQHRKENRPEIGAVHLAAGFMLSEMLGCRVEYFDDAPPAVVPAGIPGPALPVPDPFAGAAWKRLDALMDELTAQYGYITGDVNWGGVLNLALDLRGDSLFLDMLDDPDTVGRFFDDIGRTITEFTSRIASRTGSTSVSVNRIVRQCPGSVFLHSECTHTMISEQDYRRFLMKYDLEWSSKHPSYGIHFCGRDAHRFAGAFAELPHLAFLDVGWGSDVAEVRRHLPNTFLSIRLDPVSLRTMPLDTLRGQIHSRLAASAEPGLTGVCCINMDKDMPDETVCAIFEAVAEYAENTKDTQC